MSLATRVRRTPRLAVLTVVGAALAALVTGVVVTAARSNEAPPPAAVPAACSARGFPALDGEVNTSLDVERSLLTVSAFDAQRGADETFTIRFDDPTCLAVPQLARVIGHALATERQARAGTCASVRELVRSGATQARGRPVDLAAARRYVTEWC